MGHYNSAVLSHFATLLAGYLLAALAVGRQLAYQDLLPRRPADPRDLAGYDVRPISFPGRDGVPLRGWFVPSPANPNGRTLLLLHSYGRSRTRVLPHVRFFVDAGYHVLAYDQRGHGASGRAFITYGVDEGADVWAAVEALRSRPEVDMGRLGAIGLSLGSGALIYALAGRTAPSTPLKALVLEGVYARSYDVGRQMLENLFGRRGALVVGTLFFGVGTQLWALGRFRHAAPVAQMDSLPPVPLLFIRGLDDWYVPAESAAQVIGAAGEPKLVWTHRGPHALALETFPALYGRLVLPFLEAALGS